MSEQREHYKERLEEVTGTDVGNDGEAIDEIETGNRMSYKSTDDDANSLEISTEENTVKELFSSILDKLNRLLISGLQKVLSFLIEKVGDAEESTDSIDSQKNNALPEEESNQDDGSRNLSKEELEVLTVKIVNEVKSSIIKDMKSTIINEVKAEFLDEIRTEIKDDAKSEMLNEVKTEIRKGAKIEIIEEVKTELREVAKTNIKKEVEADIKKEIQQQVREEKRVVIAKQVPVEGLQSIEVKEPNTPEITATKSSENRIEILAPKTGNLRYALTAKDVIRKGQAICRVDGKAVNAPEAGELVKLIDEDTDIETDAIIAYIIVTS